jgi:hypothetical protein
MFICIHKYTHVYVYNMYMYIKCICICIFINIYNWSPAKNSEHSTKKYKLSTKKTVSPAKKYDCSLLTDSPAKKP